MTQIKSREKTVQFGPGFPTALIGERINPTGKKKIQELITKGNLDWIDSLVAEQETAGAHIIGVNMGMPEVDEPSLLAEAVSRVSERTSLPIYIDSSVRDALITATKEYPYKPLIGSATGEENSYKPLMEQLTEKQAALVILLQDEKGIPQTASDRVKIAEKVIDYAASISFDIGDLVFDCLAISVGAEPEAGIQTLECIKILARDLKVSTILGLSNISFGLPDRPIFNCTFGAMAVLNGLSAAIINPNAPNMVKTILAAEVLSGRDQFAMNYIEFFRSH